MLLILALGCLVGAISEPIHRRDGLALLATVFGVGLGTAGWVAFSQNEGLTVAQWQRFFERCRPEREAAVVWFRAIPPETGPDEIPDAPPGVKALATGNGRISVRCDRLGRRWLGIAIVSFGIDNDKVFLWSESGEKPSSDAYPVVVKSWPMGGGWWFAVTT